MSIPGMPPQAAQAIIERRKVKPFATVEEVTKEVPVTLPPVGLALLWTEQTGIYTLTASAHRERLQGAPRHPDRAHPRPPGVEGIQGSFTGTRMCLSCEARLRP